MEETGLIERLMDFGLTRQEAMLYLALVKNGELTGYEAAKETGISRSNVYSALAGLTDKGAAYIMEGAANRYVAVAAEEFCENALGKLKEEAAYLKQHMPKEQRMTEGYITIQGTRHIRDKLIHMMESCEKRMYIATTAALLKQLEPQLTEAVKRGVKTVIITDASYEKEGTILYHMEMKPGQLRFITDSAFVLTGELLGNESDTCLYSGQENLVTVFKENLSNMITLIELEEKEK